MISPSSVWAVTLSTWGKSPGSAAREWYLATWAGEEMSSKIGESPNITWEVFPCISSLA